MASRAFFYLSLISTIFLVIGCKSQKDKTAEMDRTKMLIQLQKDAATDEIDKAFSAVAKFENWKPSSRSTNQFVCDMIHSMESLDQIIKDLNAHPLIKSARVNGVNSSKIKKLVMPKATKTKPIKKQ